MSADKITQLQDILIQQVQTLPVYSALPAETKQIINAAIEISAAQSAVQITNEVESLSNQQVNQLPQTLLGPNNPIDIVNGNLSPNNVTNVLNPIAQDQLLVKLQSSLASSIVGNINRSLPAQLRGKLDVGSLVAALATNSVVSKSINNTVSSYSSDLMSGKIPVPQTVSDLENLFSRDPANALNSISQRFDSKISNKALRDAEKFNINDSENREKLRTQTTGFIDPNAEFPKKEYKGQPETNKLARGEVLSTIVQAKEKDRLKGISLPFEESFDQPPIPYKAQYPFNKVTQTESGHVIEIDDTSGAERIHLYHKSGTFVEIDSNGSVVTRKKGSSYEIIDKNGYISVTGDASLSVKGGVKIYVGQDADIEVQGDVNLKCLNDITMQAAGRVDISATEEINLHSANINIEADVNLSMKGDVNAFVHTTDYYLKANNNIYSQALNNMYGFTGASYFVQSGAAQHFRAASSINADGSRIDLNSGTSSGSQQSKYSFPANIGLIGTRKDILYEKIPDPVSANYLDEDGYKAEDSEEISESAKQSELLRRKGIASSSDLDQSAVAIESDSPSSSNSTIIKPDAIILKQNYLPDNYQLSKHFVLSQLSSKAVVSKYPVRAQVGLTYGEIVYNLAGVALNVLEPLIALYPNAIVTSAFRTAESSSSRSDHPKGKAVDIQFPGVSKAEYYNIAKKLATQLNYDKLLLEYKTYGTGLPWIHISFDVNNPRKQVLTYLNDKKYGDGLVNIA